MDVSIRPSLPEYEKADELLNLTKIIRISGPFNKLTPKVDTEQAATTLIEAGVKKLAGVQTTPTVRTSGQLCQNVLGTYAKAPATSQAKKTEQPQKTTSTTQPTQQTPKQQFKQLLLDSLSQALAPQQ